MSSVLYSSLNYVLYKYTSLVGPIHTGLYAISQIHRNTHVCVEFGVFFYKRVELIFDGVYTTITTDHHRIWLLLLLGGWGEGC